MTEESAVNSEQAPSALALLPELLSSPSSALDKIWRFGAPWWLPLIIVCGITSLTWVLYYAQLDYEWFMDYNTSSLSGDEKAQAMEGMQKMSSNTLAGITVGSIVIMVFIYSLISAGYLLLVNRVSGTQPRDFKEWLTISTWVGLPTVFIAVGGMLVLMMSGSGELAPEALSLTNLNNLVFHATKTDALFAFYNTLDVISFWSIALLAFALIKNGQSKIAAGIIAIAPQLIISGLALL